MLDRRRNVDPGLRDPRDGCPSSSGVACVLDWSETFRSPLKKTTHVTIPINKINKPQKIEAKLTPKYVDVIYEQKKTVNISYNYLIKILLC